MDHQSEVSQFGSSAPQTESDYNFSEDVEQPRNVSQTERIASSVVGGLLLLRGLRNRSLLSGAAGATLLYRGATGSCPIYKKMGISTEPQYGVESKESQHAAQSIRINRSPEEIYSFWRNFSNLPKVMPHLEQVSVIDDRRSKWIARLPFAGGRTVEWEAEVTTERPNEMIAWRSLPGSEVETEGAVRFKQPASGEGTLVSVSMSYGPGKSSGIKAASQKAVKLFRRSFQQELEENLRALKRFLEGSGAAQVRSQQSGQELRPH